MDAAGYTALTRQSGLMREMQVVANNIANISTTGFRREGVLFEEFIADGGQGPSLSMALGNARVVDQSQGPLVQTGAPFDMAIEGEGYFLIETPRGQRLSRAGSFTPNEAGELVNPDGYRLLDAGGAPVALPPEVRQFSLAADGTLSGDGTPIARIGLWQASDPTSLVHEAGTLFSTSGNEPLTEGRVMQGYLEESNVQPVNEIARMIEVQRAYELGASFMDMEDRRIRNVVDRLGR